MNIRESRSESGLFVPFWLVPGMIMNNVACAVNGEQGILALDWDGGLWMHPQEGDGSADAVHLCDDIWIPESWYSQQ